MLSGDSIPDTGASQRAPAHDGHRRCAIDDPRAGGYEGRTLVHDHQARGDERRTGEDRHGDGAGERDETLDGLQVRQDGPGPAVGVRTTRQALDIHPGEHAGGQGRRGEDGGAMGGDIHGRRTQHGQHQGGRPR